MSKYLTAIRARIEAATEGPWKAEFSGGMGNCVIPHDARSTREAVCVTRPYRALFDAEFIAHARTDLPALLAAVEDVLALHRPIEIEPSDTICAECSNQLPNGRFLPVVEWPCLTVTTIEEALG